MLARLIKRMFESIKREVQNPMLEDDLIDFDDAPPSADEMYGLNTEQFEIEQVGGMNFDTAFERVIGHEGKFQNHRSDRGNWTSGRVGEGELRGTKFGISAMTYPLEDIVNLTIERAKFLYKRDFWDRYNLSRFHSALQYQMFDIAVNHGFGNAARMLQRALDVLDDGSIGDITMGAYHLMINTRGIDDLLKLLNAERIRFFTRLSTFNDYGRGWMNRVADNLVYAAHDTEAPWCVSKVAA